MRRASRRQRWMMGLMVLSSGTLLQVTCNTIAADVVGGLTIAITNEFIRNLIYDALGVGALGGLSN
ncbi:MAG TPA: hypothetical protein PKG54_01745 [Phycisphaerae bacterium]|nr:hypothetical protein [Phycisphaerae bacterium]HOB73224.1 hypothetical protein [Phycisphaerae bacterium]HPP21498.1 hypothetical protein [Phycisphaerae bacterium]HXK84649.1 hypothetical protein [Phycisphaerae bacterium]